MKPQLITKRDQIKGVVKTWQKQYPDKTIEKDKQKILIELKKLNLKTCSEKAITKIIGNGSWTQLRCNSCARDSKAIVIVGEKPDYESCTAWLCEDCIRKAVKLFDDLPTAARAEDE